MFDKLVVSGSTGKNRRLSKFFLGSAVLYLTAVAGALIVTVVLANPQMVSATSGSSIPLLLAPPIQRVDAASSSPRPTRPAPSADLRNVVTLDHLSDARTPAASPFDPPHPPVIGAIDGNLPVGESPGTGYPFSIGDGNRLGERVSTPPAPQPRPEATPVRPRAPYTVSKGVLQGKAIFKPVPPYPQLAKLTHRFGNVDVEVIVSPEGKVESARAISGDPVFRAAAVQSALNWRFEPTRLGDTPVRVTGVITFAFKLDE